MDEKTRLHTVKTNLTILGWCYIAFGFLAILLLPIIAVQQAMLNTILNSSGIDFQQLGIDTEQLTQLLQILNICVLLLAFMHLTFNILAGIGLMKHKWYWYCFFNGIFVCLAFPLGTVLGVFTLVIISKPEAKDLFTGKFEQTGCLQEEV